MLFGSICQNLIHACQHRLSTKAYIRDKKQTHFTKVEWLNVEQEMAQASFYKKNLFIHYSHASDAKKSLSVFLKSFKAALNTTSFKAVLLLITR